jgi:hypothetical protein
MHIFEARAKSSDAERAPKKRICAQSSSFSLIVFFTAHAMSNLKPLARILTAKRI